MMNLLHLIVYLLKLVRALPDQRIPTLLKAVMIIITPHVNSLVFKNWSGRRKGGPLTQHCLRVYLILQSLLNHLLLLGVGFFVQLSLFLEVLLQLNRFVHIVFEPI